MIISEKGETVFVKSDKILVLAHLIYSVCEKMSSTSEQESTDSSVQTKIDIEAFRQHLLNYRSKPDDSELDLSYQLDLDSSFKRILNEKRQMTNKENNPAAMPSAPEPSTHTNPIEKPIRRDLLKERILHRIHDDSLNLDNSTSYVCENSISTDMEYATINRLMADFNINRDSTIGQKRTPLKALRITGEVSIDDEAFMPGVRRLISPTLDARNSDANVSLRTEQKVETVNADDTLEEIEYVKTLDRGLNYIPKRLIEKQNEMQQSDDVQDENVPSENSTKNDDDNDQTNDDDDDVIVIESSPENSFTTTRNTGLFKSALESVDNTFYTAKSNFNSKSICSISIGDDSPAKNDSGKESISSNDDDDATMENKSFPPSSCNTSKNQSFDDFNDSLERIEYMMRQGAKFLNKPMTPVPKLLTPNKIDNKLAESPKARTPIGGAIKKVLPVSSGKKPVSKNGTPSKLDLFKRPIHSPHVQTRMPTKSKIPMLNNPVISSLTKPQFRHIASPIAAYIKNTPEVPLMKTIKASKNLDGADVYDKVGNKTNVLDETTQSVESFPVKSALPKKMYISAPQRQIIDQRYRVTPGGKSVQKLIGNAPLVIRHDGKLKSHNHKQLQFEESLADLSMASGDISVQIVKDVHRK